MSIILSKLKTKKLILLLILKIIYIYFSMVVYHNFDLFFSTINAKILEYRE